MPQVKTKSITVYSFAELSDSAKETARNKWRENHLDYDWWEGVYEDATTIGALMGIAIDDIYFSGFSSQGDGAQFVGDYQYKKGSLKAVKEYAPKDTDLHQITLDLYKLQRRNFYRLSASVKHTGHYNHAMCTAIDCDGIHATGEAEYLDTEEDLKSELRSFMQWIYSRLSADYDYLMSDESIDESIEANEVEFLESGDISIW